MRATFASILALLALPSLSAAIPEEKAATPKEDAGPPSTTFNGEKVPPMIALTGKNIDELISEGNWLVEYYSPYCGHCKQFAPVLQTAYEYYYTSDPVPAGKKDNSEGLNSFTRFYDFKFAKVDCVAFNDACSAKDVNSFPTMKFYRDGKEVKSTIGSKSMSALSTWIEENLEAIRPGSRPAGGVKMPEVGADHSPEGSKKAIPGDEAKDKDPAAGAAAADKHNAVAQEEERTRKKVLPSLIKSSAPINPDGKSVNLDPETFQRLITNTRDSWFVKFYAPWCGHCQHMAPNWAQMAKEMKGKLNVGEVNCDAEKRLCKDAGVHGYPTVLFFRGGEKAEYDGLRGVGDLISYGTKAADISDGVDDVDYEEFVKLEEKEDVIFTFFYDHATTSEDFEALERLTLSLVGHGKIVKTQDKKLSDRYKIHTWPRLLVSKDGKPTFFDPLAPKDIRDVPKVKGWMQKNWLPLVPELQANNARDIMAGKILVLAILDRAGADEFELAKKELKNAAIEWIDKQTHMMQLEREELRDAKQLRIEEAEDRGNERAVSDAKRIRINMDELEHQAVGFAWVDGVFWERWLRTTYGIDIKDGPRVIINDEANHRYWDVTINNDPIRASRTSILETLRSVVSNPPKIASKSTQSTIMQWFTTVKNLWFAHPILMIGLCVGLVMLGGVFGNRRVRRTGGFGVGGDWGLGGEKGGLLGGGANGGKVD